MKRFALILVLAAGNALPVCAQTLGWPDPLQQQTYTPHRASSTDPTGANHDFRTVAPGAMLTLLDEDGPGVIAHIWFTIADNEPYSLKRIALLFCLAWHTRRSW